MKISVLGLDCAAPEVVFGDERLKNICSLMARGVYGRLESVIPPITVPASMCFSTSQDPGSLGVYGFRNRRDHSYDKLGITNADSVEQPAIWDYLAREGKKSIVVGVAPGYPPRRIFAELFFKCRHFLLLLDQGRMRPPEFLLLSLEEAPELSPLQFHAGTFRIHSRNQVRPRHGTLRWIAGAQAVDAVDGERRETRDVVKEFLRSHAN